MKNTFVIELEIDGDYDADPSNIATWIEAAMGRAGDVKIDATVWKNREDYIADLDEGNLVRPGT